MIVTSKQKAFYASIVAASTGFLAWLANTPPTNQDALLGPLVDSLPVTWRPTIGAVMKFLSSIAMVYAAIHASKSGPGTLPPTDTDNTTPPKAP